MRRRNVLSAMAGALVGALLTAAAVAWAQPKAPGGPGPGPRGACDAPAELTELSADTFVSVKDHGDAQTVIVYKVDDKGMARLTHKAKFFY